MASNFVQLCTSSLIDAYQNEPALWDVYMNASEEDKELAWARLSAMFNTSAGTNVYDLRQILLRIHVGRDSNPGPVFSIPGFGIEKFLIPGSLDPGGIMGTRRYDIKNRYY